MASASYIQRGESLDYTNSSGSDIAAGDIVVLADIMGVAGCDIPDGEKGSVYTTGVFGMPCAASAAVPIGTRLYFDGTKIVTASSGNTPAGYAAADAASGDTTIAVKING